MKTGSNLTVSVNSVLQGRFASKKDNLICKCGSSDFEVIRISSNKGINVNRFNLKCLDCGGYIVDDSIIPEVKDKLITLF